jgi:hypothetical protein
MDVIITKSQYQKIVFNLLDILYGPKLSYERKKDMIYIYPNDSNPFENESIGEGDAIFRVYTGSGKGKGCKQDMYVNSETGEEIDNFVPRAATSRTPRMKPVILEIMVPIAITPEARYRSTGFISGSVELDEQFVKLRQQRAELRH